MTKKQSFEIDWPSGYKPGDWIGVRWDSPTDDEHNFEIRLRYSKRGELLCAGLRIGEAASNLYRWVWPVDERNITRRMLGAIPLGAVLKYIQEEGVHDPAVREGMERLALLVGLPAGERSVVPGAPRKDEFYIEQAKLFAKLFAKHCAFNLSPEDRRSGRRASGAAAYVRLAEETRWAESTVRVQVRRGWELRPDLKPKGVRERHTTKKEEQS